MQMGPGNISTMVKPTRRRIIRRPQAMPAPRTTGVLMAAGTVADLTAAVAGTIDRGFGKRAGWIRSRRQQNRQSGEIVPILPEIGLNREWTQMGATPSVDSCHFAFTISASGTTSILSASA